MVWKPIGRVPIAPTRNPFIPFTTRQTACKLIYIFFKFLIIETVSVISGIGKFDAVLIEVIANRKFSAECITTAFYIHFVIIIVARLHQNRNI